MVKILNSKLPGFSINIKISIIIIAFSAYSLISCQNKKEKINLKAKETQQSGKSIDIIELYNSGKYAEFVEALEKKIGKPNFDTKLYLALSDAYGNLEKFDKAFFYARKQLELVPADYYTLLAIGNYHFLLEKLDSAEIYYLKVLDLNPNYARANLNLAQLYEEQKKKNEAIEQYIKAIELFKANGLDDEVVFYSKKALSIDPNNKILEEYLIPDLLKSPED